MKKVLVIHILVLIIALATCCDKYSKSRVLEYKVSPEFFKRNFNSYNPSEIVLFWYFARTLPNISCSKQLMCIDFHEYMLSVYSVHKDSLVKIKNPGFDYFFCDSNLGLKYRKKELLKSPLTVSVKEISYSESKLIFIYDMKFELRKHENIWKIINVIPSTVGSIQ